MTKLNYREMKRLLKAVERLNEDAAPETLFERIGAATKIVVPSEANCFDSFNEKNEMRTFDSSPHDFFPSKLVETLHFCISEHPLFDVIAKQRKQTAYKVTDFCSLPRFFDTGIYSEVYRKVNVRNQLIVGFNVSARDYTTCCISRESLRRDFSEAERLSMNLLKPHLRASFRNARLIENLRRAANGDGWQARKMTAQNVRKPTLTARETEILNWLSEGKADAEIAFLCRISPRTVHQHLRNIYDKFGVENRTAAVLRAMELSH